MIQEKFEELRTIITRLKNVKKKLKVNNQNIKMNIIKIYNSRYSSSNRKIKMKLFIKRNL
jgi:hypothetical protein